MSDSAIYAGDAVDIIHPSASVGYRFTDRKAIVF